MKGKEFNMTPAPKALVFIQDENRAGLYFIESGAADPSTGVRSESNIVAADGGQGLNYLYLGSVFNIPNFPYHVIFLRELRADGAQRDVCIHVPRVSDNLFPPPEGLYPVYEVNHYSAGFPILADDAKIESLGDWAPVYRQWCEHLHQQNTRQFMPVLVQPVPVPVPVYVSEPEFGQHALAANTPMPLSSSTEIVTKFLQTVPDVATAFATAEQTKAAPTTQKVTVSVAAAGASAETNTAATQPVSKLKSKTKQTATQSAAYLDTSSDTATRIAEAVSAAEFLASESLAQFDSAVQFFDLEAPANFIKEVRNICLRNIEFVKLLEPNIANSGLGFEKLFAVFTTQINDLSIDEVTLNIYQAILKRFFEMLASNTAFIEKIDPRGYEWLKIKTFMQQFTETEAASKTLKNRIDGFCEKQITRTKKMPVIVKPQVTKAIKPTVKDDAVANAARLRQIAADRRKAKEAARQRAIATRKAAAAKETADARADAAALKRAATEAKRTGATKHVATAPKSEFDELAAKIQDGKFGIRDLRSLEGLSRKKPPHVVFTQQDAAGETLLMKLLHSNVTGINADTYSKLIKLLIEQAGAEIIATDLTGQSVLHHWAKRDMSKESELHGAVFSHLYAAYAKHIPSDVKAGLNRVEYKIPKDFVTDDTGATFLHILFAQKQNLVMQTAVFAALYRTLDTSDNTNGLAGNIIAPLLIAKQDGSNIYNMLEKMLIESSLIGDAKTEAKCLESLQSIVILTARLGIKFDETLTQTKSNPNSSKNDFLGFTDDFMDFFDFENPDNNFARLLIEVDQVDAAKCQKIHEILEKVLELRTRLRVDRVYNKFAVFSYNDILAVLMSETDNEMANFLIHNWLLVNQDDKEILSKLFKDAMVFVPMYLKYGAHSFYDNLPDQAAAFRLLDRITKAWGAEQQPALWNSATLRGVTAYLYSNDHDLDMYSDFLTNYLAPMVDLQVASYDNTILFDFAIELQNVFEDIIKNGDKARDILLERINQVLTIIFDNKALDVVESAINSKNADGKLFYEMFANQQIGSAVQKFVTDYIRNRRLQEGAASSPRNTA
jgi:hypothetical protein